MAGLQRSVETFRRSGSSGLVWEDRFSGEPNKNQEKQHQFKKEGEEGQELRRSRSVGSSGAVMERSQSNGGRGYRTGRVSPALDPPSPKVSGCGFCGVFGKPGHSKKPKTSKRNKWIFFLSFLLCFFLYVPMFQNSKIPCYFVHCFGSSSNIQLKRERSTSIFHTLVSQFCIQRHGNSLHTIHFLCSFLLFYFIFMLF